MTRNRGTQAPAPKPKAAPINNDDIVKDFRARGGGIIHFRPRPNFTGGMRRGMTIAYILKSGHIEVSTAVQHRHDTFTKKVGTKLAIQHFDDGRTINIPYIGKKGVGDWLKYTFSL